MGISLQNLYKRILKLEELLKVKEQKNNKKKLQMEVIGLDWKHHGWVGEPWSLADDRPEWREAQETINLVREYDKHNL